MLIQDDVVVAVHGHALVTRNAPDPPLAGNDAWLLESVNVHDDPGWSRVKPVLPIAMEAVRSCNVLLGAANHATVPLPVPEVAPVSVSQSALLVAVHEQLLALAVTAMLPVAPAVAAVAETGEMVMAQTPACVTLKDCPPTLMEADRDAVPVFGAALYRMVVLPEPLAGVAVSQSGLLLEAVHGQLFVDVVRLKDPVAPFVLALADVGEIE